MRAHKAGSIRAVFSAALHNWDVLLCFEILYRSFGFAVWFPFLRFLLSLLPGLAGEPYLGHRNFYLIFRHPPALLLFAAILLLTALFLFFEVIALFVYGEKGWNRQRASVWGLIKEALQKSAGLFHPKRLAVFLLLPLLLFSVFSFISGYLKNIQIPEFLMEFIQQSAPLVVVCAGMAVLFHLALFLYLFGLPELLLKGNSFAGSWRESVTLLKRAGFRPLWKAFLYLLLFWMLSTAAAALGVILLALGLRLFTGLEVGRGQFQLYFTWLKGIWSIASGALSSVFLCVGIIVLYHQAKGEDRCEKQKMKWNMKRLLLRAGSAAGVVILLMVFSESEIGGALPAMEPRQTLLVAHRAGAAFAAENTVAALLGAIEDQAEMAEIDVQQLKDGSLIVMHDTNFKRIAGRDLSVWDADSASVRELETVEPVATLEEMLLSAKGRIALMIELKATGHEQELEEKTLALIREHGMEEQCLLASMDMGILKRVKALNPDMRTVYISVILLTGQYDLKELDAYSVETTSLSAEMVIQAHLQGKQVYAWTANSEETINKVLRCGADGLITDNIPLAKYCMDTNFEDLLLEELTDFFFPQA